jgi:hypothetical protein
MKMSPGAALSHLPFVRGADVGGEAALSCIPYESRRNAETERDVLVLLPAGTCGSSGRSTMSTASPFLAALERSVDRIPAGVQRN